MIVYKFGSESDVLISTQNIKLYASKWKFSIAKLIKIKINNWAMINDDFNFLINLKFVISKRIVKIIHKNKSYKGSVL